MGTKILIAEDGAVSRRLLEIQLSDWGYSVIAVENGSDALRELKSMDAPKLAILDWMMPGMDGPEVVREIRKAKPDSYVYVLLLTAKSNKSDLLFGLDSGADDFLTKPFDAEELRARLRVGERIISLKESLVQARVASDFRASHDALTGLYNRGAIMNLLQREITRCAREKSKLGVILADIDHFKAINDNHGHNAGDQALLEVAGRMQSALRSYDFLGRYGGEEFLVVAPGCGAKEAPDVAERLRTAVFKSPVLVGNAAIDVTISLGVSVAGACETMTALLKRADWALYEAKDAGRNASRFQPVAIDETGAPLQFVRSNLSSSPSNKIQ